MKFTKEISPFTLAVSMICSSFQMVGYADDNVLTGQIVFEDGSPVSGVKVNILSSAIEESDDDVTAFSKIQTEANIMIMLS